MTAFGSSPQFNPTFIDGVAPVEDLPLADQPVAVAFPGRWVGGALGVVASLIVGVPLALLGWTLAEGTLLFAAGVCALGMPVAFVLGRHLAPIGVESSTSSPTSAVLTFALLAPLLGNLEIVAGGVVLSSDNPAAFGSFFAFGLLVAFAGSVVCFVALPVTTAVALVWIVLVRALPTGWMAEHRAPASLERLGVRHAVAAILLIAVAIRLAIGLVAPSNFSW
jgi:hypothetical protein